MARRTTGQAEAVPARRFVALLRGVNVGGNNLIKMADLKTCLEETGFSEVVTYIQSGNVVFASSTADAAASAKAIEAAIASRFGHAVWALVLSREEMREVVASAPLGFGTRPEEYRYDVIFVR